MNLGTLTRFAALAAFSSSAIFANAQTVSMWWNKTGDAAVAAPGSFLDVQQGTASVNLSVYMTTAGFNFNLQNVSVMFGYDTTTTGGASAVAGGSGLSVTNVAAPVWNSAGLANGSVFAGSFGGATAPSGSRPWGLWETYVAGFGQDFGVSNVSALKLYSIQLNLAPTLVAGDVRDVSIVASNPIGAGAYDSNVSDIQNNVRNASTYTARIRIVNTVPEPATFAVLGLGAFALLRRRKK